MTPHAQVVLPAAVLRKVLAHARRAVPNECCGLLIGATRPTTSVSSIDENDVDETEVDIQIESSAPARNLRLSPTRYLIDPADHFAAIRTARARGRAVVGGYHSHPSGPPDASTTDHRDASDAAFLYLIVSPGTGAVKAWRLAAGRLGELTMRIVRDREC
ncbi:MAG: M67 family metallopeptidase [Vicinamibacterales bacterium]|nr:M67 family metallopeptidase [Vicinamibacterales bacterium]